MKTEVKTITYTKLLGTYVLGFKKMDTHMAEMMSQGWRVQAQNAQDGKKRILMGNTADSMTVTYIKD
jgi:hypothetical protein